MWSEAKQRDWPEAGRDPGPFSGRRRKTGGRVRALKVCNVGSHKHYFYVYLYGLHYWWQIERNKWIALLFFFLQLKFFRKLRLCQWWSRCQPCYTAPRIRNLPPGQSQQVMDTGKLKAKQCRREHRGWATQSFAFFQIYQVEKWVRTRRLGYIDWYSSTWKHEIQEKELFCH